MSKISIRKIGPYTYEIPRYVPDMRVPGRVYADEKLLNKMKQDLTLQQCANVAWLPGIYKYSITLPDGHQGYGFPIGGVAAFDAEEGIISPGGIGYDINCGVRLLRTDLTAKEARTAMPSLLEEIFRQVPAGVGRGGRVRLSIGELDSVLQEGVDWAIDHGYGWSEDREHLEENGRMEGADPDKVSPRAKQRGAPQLGTLGAGNHFLEVQMVDKIYDEHVAKVFNLPPEGGVTIMVHCGSRGFGHQVCSDYIRVMDRAVHKFHIKIPDRELVCAPFTSREGEDYFAAMACAVNFAFCNRHMIMHWVRKSFEKVYRRSAEDLGIRLVYGVCHNVGKKEAHRVDGARKEVVIHRKGATRAFPPGHTDVPSDYRSVGQPVIIPGSMGTASYVLVGTKKGEEIAWSSTAHGAGRTMSRMRAKRSFRGTDVESRLRSRGILVKAASWRVVSEEAPEAYKDIDAIANISDALGIATKVARLVPLGVVKG